MPSASRPYRKFVVDTGPLITALALEFRDRVPQINDLSLKALRMPDYLIDPANQTNFRRLLGNAEEILVSSYAVGEVRSDTHMPKNLQKTYWQGCVAFFDGHNVSEHLITLVDLNGDDALRAILYEHGPTDASLVALARREGCLLLTDDERLYRWQQAGGHFKVELVKNIVSH